MLPLDVPFTPERKYVQFLAKHRSELCSVHFSVYDSGLADARQRLEQPEKEAILAGLDALGDLPKFVLMNSRLHAPDKYFSTSALDASGEILSRLLDEVGLTGLIFSDPYYLQALSDAHPELVGRLEAVPSVNAMLDSPSRVSAMLDVIGATGFKAPSRLVLDRSLNRDLARLKETSRVVRSQFRDIKLHLIANEGCLYQCPYKPAHDAHVAIVNEELCGERTFAMNRDFGCIRRLLSDHGAMLASPFIRPEDVSQLDGVIDGIKLCGRNRGTPFLENVVFSYLAEKYDGNLLNLMDAMGDLADRVHIPASQLPEDFFKQVSTCNKLCSACGWCAGVAKFIAVRLDPGLA